MVSCVHLCHNGVQRIRRRRTLPDPAPRIAVAGAFVGASLPRWTPCRSTCARDCTACSLGDLDDEQREAVLAPRGPVCVLAGAGTGKTRTITRRIAHLVAAGHVAAGPGAGGDVHLARRG